jgi:hypothetical protein
MMLGVLAGVGGCSNPLGSKDEHTLRIFLTSSYGIEKIFISKVSAETWGDNIIARILRRNEYQDFRLQDDIYDIKLIDEDNDEYVIRNLNFKANLTWFVDYNHNRGTERGDFEGLRTGLRDTFDGDFTDMKPWW